MKADAAAAEQKLTKLTRAGTGRQLGLNLALKHGVLLLHVQTLTAPIRPRATLSGGRSADRIGNAPTPSVRRR